MSQQNGEARNDNQRLEPQEESYEYDKQGRLKYHPEIHESHKQPWLQTDEKFLIDNYVTLGPEAVSLALGRTIHVVMTRACNLRKAGKMKKRVPGTRTHKRTRQVKRADTGKSEATS